MQFPARRLLGAVVLSLIVMFPGPLSGKTSEAAKQELTTLLLGKDITPLVDLPATKEGVDVYFVPPQDKRVDERGLDLEDLSKWLKEKGIGAQSQSPETITDVKVEGKLVEIHISGGGEGRRGSNHANRVNAGLLRAGGSRVNFRYPVELTDNEIQPETFLKFMARVLDVSEIQLMISAKSFSPEIQQAISARTVTEGMTYQMVQLSFGDPEQKKINDTTDGSFSETWCRFNRSMQHPGIS